MPIKWSALRVTEAMEMAEGYVNEAIEPLEQAKAVAEAARAIPNLPQYIDQHLLRFIGEIERVIPAMRYGQQSQGNLKAAIQSVRDSIPANDLEAEKRLAQAGTQQSLLV